MIIYNKDTTTQQTRDTLGTGGLKGLNHLTVKCNRPNWQSIDRTI